ncbi:MAG: hypothetical protein LBJ00_06955 [Planctomycetaceae bacterium]|nr:hypothetical protein [Planctomycetaceae bacterium]
MKIDTNFFKNDLLFYDFMPFRYFKVCIDFDGYIRFTNCGGEFVENITKKVFIAPFSKANILIPKLF